MNCRLQVAQKALHLRPLTIPDAGEEIDDPLLMPARHPMKASAKLCRWIESGQGDIKMCSYTLSDLTFNQQAA